MHFERQNAFQNAFKKIFFRGKKYVCLPYLKFSDLLPETHLFFKLPNCEIIGETDHSFEPVHEFFYGLQLLFKHPFVAM